MKVKILRYNSENDSSPYYQSFQVPFSDDDEYTVTDVLDYISVNIDPTLAYFKHSACDHGICGRCAVKMNEKNVLACTTVVDCSRDMVLEPVSEKHLVKDLVVRIP